MREVEFPAKLKQEYRVAYLQGAPARLPIWELILDASEAWGKAPWEIEEEASRIWWERYKLRRDFRIRSEKREVDRLKRESKRFE